MTQWQYYTSLDNYPRFFRVAATANKAFLKLWIFKGHKDENQVCRAQTTYHPLIWVKKKFSNRRSNNRDSRPILSVTLSSLVLVQSLAQSECTLCLWAVTQFSMDSGVSPPINFFYRLATATMTCKIEIAHYFCARLFKARAASVASLFLKVFV